MFVKQHHEAIEEAMRQNNPEKVFQEIGNGVKQYAKKINEAFITTPFCDTAYILAAIDLFRDSILKSVPLSAQEDTELLVKEIKLICRVSAVRREIHGAITEEAADEWYRSMWRSEKG